jgi:hypothetical protein
MEDRVVVGRRAVTGWAERSTRAILVKNVVQRRCMDDVQVSYYETAAPQPKCVEWNDGHTRVWPWKIIDPGTILYQTGPRLAANRK